MNRKLIAIATAGALLGGCAGPAAGRAEPAETPSARPASAGAPAEIAQVRGPDIAVYPRRDATRPKLRLSNPNSYGAPRVLLVERRDGDRLQVSLPVRPNGSTGWVDAADVTTSTTPMRVEVETERFRFTVRDGDRVVRTGRVAAGTGDTPTPEGRFYFTELLRPRDPGGPYGAYAFGLSAHSEVLTSFAGGPGQVAVHGTGDPGSLGRAVSHGCVRVSNADITWMAENLTIGTPVVIH